MPLRPSIQVAASGPGTMIDVHRASRGWPTSSGPAKWCRAVDTDAHGLARSHVFTRIGELPLPCGYGYFIPRATRQGTTASVSERNHTPRGTKDRMPWYFLFKDKKLRKPGRVLGHACRCELYRQQESLSRATRMRCV